MKIKPKNSELNKNKIAAALQNANIKNKTDSTGLMELHIKNPEPSKRRHKKRCK
jgi:hypothetical protein